MTITLNGESRDFEGDRITLESLLESLLLTGKPVVVELNRLPVLPDAYASTFVGCGDSLEVVRISAGG